MLELVLCSKYRYDDVSSQRFGDTSIDTAGPVSILWHVCSSVDRTQGSQNFKIPGSPSGRYYSDFGSLKINLTSPNKKRP